MYSFILTKIFHRIFQDSNFEFYDTRHLAAFFCSFETEVDFFFTVKKNTRIKPQIKPVRDYGEASFQFRSKRGRGSEDNFDALVQEPKRSKNANEDVGNTTRSGRSTKKNPKYK